MVVETMHREKLSHKEVERQFAITSHSCVPNWERIYLTEGPEGLYSSAVPVWWIQQASCG